MTHLTNIITAADPAVRNLSLDAFCRGASPEDLLPECAALDRFRRASDNLYERVRALFFLYAIHRFHLPFKPGIPAQALIPFRGYEHLLHRRFDEAIEVFLAAQSECGPSAAISSALAAAYHGLGFQTLAGQVRRSVRTVVAPSRRRQKAAKSCSPSSPAAAAVMAVRSSACGCHSVSCRRSGSAAAGSSHTR